MQRFIVGQEKASTAVNYESGSDTDPTSRCLRFGYSDDFSYMKLSKCFGHDGDVTLPGVFLTLLISFSVLLHVILCILRIDATKPTGLARECDNWYVVLDRMLFSSLQHPFTLCINLQRLFPPRSQIVCFLLIIPLHSFFQPWEFPSMECNPTVASHSLQNYFVQHCRCYSLLLAGIINPTIPLYFRQD